MIFRYYDKDGTLICEADTVDEMAHKTGMTVKQISQRVRSWRHRIGSPNVRKPAYPYMECDDDTFAARDDISKRFLKMYFDGKSVEEIQKELHANDNTMRYLYKTQLGIMPPIKRPPRNTIQKQSMPEGFWKEWDETRLALLNSGADLNIKITYME